MGTDKIKLNFDEDLPLRDVVFKALRSSILKGDFKPGERLMEIKLADLLGVSRTPIREALRMLEQDGLVTMMPRKGVEVARISRVDLEDVLEVRKALDNLAIELACDKITPEELDALKKASKEFGKSVESKDAYKIAEADVNFHNIINMASGNHRLITIEENIAERMFRYRLEYIKKTDDYKQLIREHEALVKAISEGDKVTAIKVSNEHIDCQFKSILDSLA